MVTVLIVDDNLLIRESLARYLKSKGMQVQTAPDAVNALVLFREQKPDAVILDLGLPDRDGSEVLIEMKQLDQNIPIGILSGYSERKKELLEKGAAGFFGKPFLPPEIEKWIAEVVKK
jgi:two-component system KDP operon response regulator KdpE